MASISATLSCSPDVDFAVDLPAEADGVPVDGVSVVASGADSTAGGLVDAGSLAEDASDPHLRRHPSSAPQPKSQPRTTSFFQPSLHYLRLHNLQGGNMLQFPASTAA